LRFTQPRGLHRVTLPSSCGRTARMKQPCYYRPWKLCEPVWRRW
jgi:hypothetical protein